MGRSEPERAGDLGVKRGRVGRSVGPGDPETWYPCLGQGPSEDHRLPQPAPSADDREPLSRPDGVDDPRHGLVVGRGGDVRATLGREWVANQVPMAEPHGALSGAWPYLDGGHRSRSIPKIGKIGPESSLTIARGGLFVADRFYCPKPWLDGQARLDGDEARHLSRVRRVQIGDRVTLFDGQGGAAIAEVAEVGRDRVDLRIIEVGGLDRSHSGPLVLATAVPKGDRFDWLVEKATELGVTRLVPLITERSAVDPRSAKLDRLRRVVIEASKQSGRDRLMDLDPPTPLATWLRGGAGGLGSLVLAHPSGSRLADGPRLDMGRGVAVMIGPEGGFTDAEVEEATRAGYRPVGLGPTILRVETAALTACVTVLTWSETGKGATS